jgi:hypothetical protein
MAASGVAIVGLTIPVRLVTVIELVANPAIVVKSLYFKPAGAGCAGWLMGLSPYGLAGLF